MSILVTVVIGVCAAFTGVVAGHIRGRHAGYAAGVKDTIKRITGAMLAAAGHPPARDPGRVHEAAGILADLINPKER